MSAEEPGTGRKLVRIYTDPFVWAILVLSLVLTSQVHTFAGFAFLAVSLAAYMLFVGGYL